MVGWDGYLYEYVGDWRHEKPYTHYIVMVNYALLKEYKRYAIMGQGRLSLSDTLTNLRGNVVPVLIEKAEEVHPRTQGILASIRLREE